MNKQGAQNQMSLIIWAEAEVEYEGMKSSTTVNPLSDEVCCLCPGSWWIYSAMGAAQLSPSGEEPKTNIDTAMQTAVWKDWAFAN